MLVVFVANVCYADVLEDQLTGVAKLPFLFRVWWKVCVETLRISFSASMPGLAS